MSQEERYGTRDQSYSAWHRSKSTERFVSAEQARKLAMIDLDACPYIEYGDGNKEPIALIETARDIGQPIKPATVTQKLAIRAQLPAYTVLYTCSAHPNPADPTCLDIASFRVQRLWPEPSRLWEIYAPQEWAIFLLRLREIETAKADLLRGKAQVLAPEPPAAAPVAAKPARKGRLIHDFEEFCELWPAFFVRLKKKYGVTIVAYLNDAQPVEFTETEAVLEFHKEFHYEKACEAARRLPFEQDLNQVLAEQRRLRFRLAKHERRAITEAEEDVFKTARDLFAAQVVARSGS